MPTGCASGGTPGKDAEGAAAVALEEGAAAVGILLTLTDNLGQEGYEWPGAGWRNRAQHMSKLNAVATLPKDTSGACCTFCLLPLIP